MNQGHITPQSLHGAKRRWSETDGMSEEDMLGCYINYSNTTKNNILFIDVSASRWKSSSGQRKSHVAETGNSLATTDMGLKAFLTRKSQRWFIRYRAKTVNVSTLEKQEGHWQQE